MDLDPEVVSLLQNLVSPENTRRYLAMNRAQVLVDVGNMLYISDHDLQLLRQKLLKNLADSSEPPSAND